MPRIRIRSCLYCQQLFHTRRARAVLACSPYCRQNLRRLRELDWRIRHTPILRFQGEKKYPPGFVKKED